MQIIKETNYSKVTKILGESLNPTVLSSMGPFSFYNEEADIMLLIVDFEKDIIFMMGDDSTKFPKDLFIQAEKILPSKVDYFKNNLHCQVNTILYDLSDNLIIYDYNTETIINSEKIKYYVKKVDRTKQVLAFSKYKKPIFLNGYSMLSVIAQVLNIAEEMIGNDVLPANNKLFFDLVTEYRGLEQPYPLGIKEAILIGKGRYNLPKHSTLSLESRVKNRLLKKPPTTKDYILLEDILSGAYIYDTRDLEVYFPIDSFPQVTEMRVKRGVLRIIGGDMKILDFESLAEAVEELGMEVIYCFLPTKEK